MQQFRFNKILCPVDFSDYSELILRYGSVFAQTHGAGILLLYAIPEIENILGFASIDPPDYKRLREKAFERTRELSSELIAPQIKSELLVEIGPAAGTILSVADRQKADLIVVATHGLTGYERFLLGSVAYKLIHTSDIPLLVVRKPARAAAHEEKPLTAIRRILFAADLAPGCREQLDAALSLAQTHKAELILMHVTPTEDQVRERKAELDEFAANVAGVKTVVRAGSVAARILQAIDEFGVDLAVTGHYRHLAVEEWIPSGVALRVVTDAPCPVLVFRAHKTPSN
jgi:nucleotide-binding universal stress UspA family protein